MSWLGLDVDPRQLTFLQISARGTVVFLATLVIVRCADRRFMARLAAFDVVLGFMLASMLARAVNGSASFVPTIAGGFVLVGLHRLLAWAAYRWDAFGILVKGEPRVAVRDGRVDEHVLRAHRISLKDLLQEARLNGNVDSLDDIEIAVVERSGDISVVRRSPRR